MVPVLCRGGHGFSRWCLSYRLGGGGGEGMCLFFYPKHLIQQFYILILFYHRERIVSLKNECFFVYLMFFLPFFLGGGGLYVREELGNSYTYYRATADVQNIKKVIVGTATNVMSDTPKWHLSHYDLWGLSVMTLVALWCLSVMIYLSSYYVCRSWSLSLMTFVALWRLSPIMMFVAHDVITTYDVCRLWRLSHYDIYHQLWCLSLMTFIMTFITNYDVCRL